MKLLLISNSTNAGEEFLQHPIKQIKQFLEGVKNVLFVPYAAVTFSYDEFEKIVQERFEPLGITVESLHRHSDVKQAIRDAEAIVVGGGNTFKLLKTIQMLDVVELIRLRVLDGMAYVGWSAGANLACPTICTTNDMPIVEPESFNALNLVRFQINPHYLDANPQGHAGETREERIEEFITMDPFPYVVGLREGSMLRIEDAKIELLGPKPARIFKSGEEAKEYSPGNDLDFLFL